MAKDRADLSWRKRSAERDHDIDEREDTGSESEDDFGPALPSQDVPKKKRRHLKHERTYLDNIPSFERYTKSYMHRDNLAYLTVATATNFLLTLSVDGYLKFWKKRTNGIEFVKQMAAHSGTVTGADLSVDGKFFASVATDNTIKVFDIVNFDMINIFKLPFSPSCICWLQKHNNPDLYLAVADQMTSRIFIYDARGESDPLRVLPEIHKFPVVTIGFNAVYNCAVSVDNKGLVEYWRPGSSTSSTDAEYEQPEDLSFEYKSSTDLYEFRKNKCVPTCLDFSRDGKRFVTWSMPDRQIRIFDYKTGKLHRKYDESITVAYDMQQTGTAVRVLDDVEFRRRISGEQELEKNEDTKRFMNAIFDQSGNFVLYPTHLGIKVVNIVTNRCVRLLGSEDNVRFINLALYQGAPDRKDIITVEMAASDNALVLASLSTDPTLFASGVGKKRFYMFTNSTEPFNKIRSERDVFNEKPTKLDAGGKSATTEEPTIESNGVTLHTTLGDIQIRLYPEHAPLTVENFVTLCKRGYYNNTIFHRVIKKFMIQGGDPLGDGTGGESMWGKPFKDEFSPALKHDKPFTVSMANAGPNTNGSQFFITTERTPWLDGKHTIFGRVVMGMEVVKRIEGLRTSKTDRPEDPPNIVSITVL
ncbi:uncharacterized protein V1516DRAFT_698232 [Lipomyces oligophaga]|uniref:uncharacterized protein n=1 Tax=Lipomyces oligophaga TaxID=45792 RepID=UPI0034CD6C34